MVVKKKTLTSTVKKTVKKAVKKVAKTAGVAKKTVSKTKKITSDEFFQKIQEKSYELFISQGYYHGNDMGNWLTAEQEISKKFTVK